LADMVAPTRQQAVTVNMPMKKQTNDLKVEI